MPVLYRKHIKSSLSVEVWHLTESEDFFQSNVPISPEDKETIVEMPLAKRRLERWGCRMALHDLIQFTGLASSIGDLRYDQNGRPQLPGVHISFSHAGEFVAVAISEVNPVGIDIEPIGQRLRNVFTHFLNDDERRYCDTSNDRELHYFWGGKEALYKLQNISHYQKGIMIKPISEKTGYIFVGDQWEQHPLWHAEIEGYCIVVAY